MSRADLAHHGAKFSILVSVVNSHLKLLRTLYFSFAALLRHQSILHTVIVYVLHSLIQTNHKVLCEVANVQRIG